MTKTITTTFTVPDSGKMVRINLEDTEGIRVGSALRIGFDHYTISLVYESSIVIIKHPTMIPSGLECWISEPEAKNE
jgi:GTPase